MQVNSLLKCMLTVCLALVLLGGCSTAPKSSDQASFGSRSLVTTDWFERNVSGLSAQIDQSAGYVVFPDVKQWGILVGGGQYGRGMLCKPDGTQIGWAAINTGSIGLQAGVKGFKLMMLLQDEATLNKFKTNQLTGTASGTAVAGREGVSGTAKFEDGVVIYQGAEAGLMAGVNIGLNYIRYEPMSAGETPGDSR